MPITDIVKKYRTFLNKKGMYLIQNDLLFVSLDNEVKIIPYIKLHKLEVQKIEYYLRFAKLIILGGLAYSGYNLTFNADSGVYGQILDRKAEISESEKFEGLYNKLLPILINKNSIVFTHTPKKDWCRRPELDKNVIYLNGHTHKNIFYDDGCYRIYSDNQIGYKNGNNIFLKCFFVNSDCDCFSSYSDGVYTISLKQYREFLLGKNIQAELNREIKKLYMLKKNGHYCFILLSPKGVLYILNGGNIKKLDTSITIDYLYDNMDTVINIVKDPLKKYLQILQNISEEIKKIGGTGIIHGCIVDIDFYNHVYVNPIDMKITGYYAEDMIYKKLYPTVHDLLKDQCPALYSNYIKYINNNDSDSFVSHYHYPSVIPEVYLNTDIYAVSRIVSKMQRLIKNILTVWPDDLHPNNSLSKKENSHRNHLK